MINYIAIGSVSRSGKDSLAQLIKENLEEKGYRVIKKSLAEPLKEICNEFLINNFGISAFTEVTEEKTIVRPFLVTVGGMLRRQSKGTYFTKILTDYVNSLKEKPNFVIVPDLRYSEYDGTDELSFFQKLGGYIINISRLNEQNVIIEPANDDEYINSQKISSGAHINLLWPTYGTTSCEKMKEFAEYATTQVLKNF